MACIPPPVDYVSECEVAGEGRAWLLFDSDLHPTRDRAIFTARRYATRCRRVSVRLSVTRRYCTKMHD